MVNTASSNEIDNRLLRLVRNAFALLPRVLTVAVLVAIASAVGTAAALGTVLAMVKTGPGRSFTNAAISPGDYTGYGGLMLILFMATSAFLFGCSITLLVGKRLTRREVASRPRALRHQD